jgi:hypothetical protein
MLSDQSVHVWTRDASVVEAVMRAHGSITTTGYHRDERGDNDKQGIGKHFDASICLNEPVFIPVAASVWSREFETHSKLVLRCLGQSSQSGMGLTSSGCFSTDGKGKITMAFSRE